MTGNRSNWTVVLATGVLVVVLALASCGGESGVTAEVPDNSGGNPNRGPDLRGTVELPNGELVMSTSPANRLASLVAGRAEALTADVQPVGAGVVVQLVELRPDDLALGVEPPVLTSVRTNEVGDYLISLPGGTNENVCRFMLQVGSRETGTLTRAFVFTIREPIVIDYRSEAVVRLVLSEIPPAGLCDFDARDLAGIYDAVVEAPGDIFSVTVAGTNAVAFGLAQADPGVQAAIDAALD